MFESANNVAKNSKPLEVLFIGCSSSDPYSIIAINPWTGISSWSYKGTELQNASVGIVKPIGLDGKHFLVNVNERPVIHVKGFHPKDRHHSMSFLPEPATNFVTSKDGLLLFVAIKTKIYVYMLTSGSLIVSFETHYQNISDLALSYDSSLLITSSLDGSIHVYLVADIVNVDRQTVIYPVRKWKAHSLSIRSIAVSCGRSPRILSVGMDHVAFLHSISMDACLLKISAERPLTACTLDSAETRIFIGTDTGRIAQINLYDIGNRQEILIQTSSENAKIPVFNGHSCEISKLVVNSDGTLLASGDVSGKYCLWDIASKQCIKVSTMKGSITSLEFLPNFSSFQSTTFDAPVHRPKIATNARLEDLSVVNQTFQDETKKWIKSTDDLIDSSLKTMLHKNRSIRDGDDSEKDSTMMDPQGDMLNEDGDDEVTRLRKEVLRLKRINERLYLFGVDLVLKQNQDQDQQEDES